MAALHINEILGKINELRAVFVLGQRAVPFLEEVFVFLKEISPLLDEINSSIRDSTHKMPRATSQLQSVTQATELATTEILDLIDLILARLTQSRTGIEKDLIHLEAMGRADTRMLRLLRSRLRDDELMRQVEAIHEEKKALRRGVASHVQLQMQATDEIRSRMNRIMISLQVQDITSQQIAAVNHLIESIRDRMAQLIERLACGTADVGVPGSVPTAAGNGAFDPDARYDRSGRRQAAADALILGLAPAGRAGQAPIELPSAPEPDRNGDGHDASIDAPPPSRRAIDNLFDQSRDQASQDEIDQLFGSCFP
jgi:chemotaxis regulatin CheY-phosphate phosphatase CheZ